MSVPVSVANSSVPWSVWPRHLWQTLLVFWILFWLLMILAAVQDSLDNEAIRWWQPLVWEGSSALVITVFGKMLLCYSSRQQHLLATPWRWLWQHLQWLPLMSAIFVVCAFGLRHGIYALLGTTYTHDTWLHLYVYETIKLGLFIGLWLGVLFGFHYFLAWSEQQDRLHATQQALAGVRLQQLKAQLQPHFLFNTLNTISGFIHSDADRADRLLTQLADLLRANLTLGEQQLVPFEEELRLLHLYSNIMLERFASQVQITWDVADDTLAFMVPALLLQPLLENAFKHGVEQATDITFITIGAKRVDNRLQITIGNNPVKPDAGSRAGLLGTGLGLRNCRERLQAIYGASASLQLQVYPDHFEVGVLVPEAAA